MEPENSRIYALLQSMIEVSEELLQENIDASIKAQIEAILPAVRHRHTIVGQKIIREAIICQGTVR